MLVPRASASATMMRAADDGARVTVATSADSAPIERPGRAVSVPAETSPTLMASVNPSKRIGTLLKLLMRTSSDQLPSMRTDSCWMLAAGSETRRGGPLAHAASSRQVAAMTVVARRFMPAPGIFARIHRRVRVPGRRSVDEALAQRIADQFCGIAHVQLVEHPSAMVLGGLDADVELARDFLGRMAFGDQVEDFPLARRQAAIGVVQCALRMLQLVGQRAGGLRTEVTTPRVHAANRRQQFGGGAVLDQVSRRSCAYGLQDVFVLLV